MRKSASSRFFFRVFLPLSVLANIGLGLLVLSDLRPAGWLEWLEVGTGAFCCFVGGWLAASAWSKTYWGRAMAVQIGAWQKITDAIFGWMEEAPPPVEALDRLKRSLDEAAPPLRRTT